MNFFLGIFWEFCLTISPHVPLWTGDSSEIPTNGNILQTVRRNMAFITRFLKNTVLFFLKELASALNPNSCFYFGAQSCLRVA